MLSIVEKVLFLKKVELFRNIDSETLAHIADMLLEETHPEGSLLVREGDVGDALYILVEGHVLVHHNNTPLAELGPRTCVGEMAVLDAEPRSASVTARTDVTMLKLMQHDFNVILQENNALALGIIAVLIKRLREANQR